MSRSENMRAIRSKGMWPELSVRRIVHGAGFRYRLHRSDLPGKPDLVFGPRQKVIFVHGCFWHGHGCKAAHIPKSNIGYWGPKLERNRVRDAKNIEDLILRGWKVLVIWECETKNKNEMKARIKQFLGGQGDD